MTTGMGTLLGAIPAGSQAWEQVWPSRPGKAQKLHAAHPWACSTCSVLQSTVLSATSCSQPLAPEPPVNAGSLLSAY